MWLTLPNFPHFCIGEFSLCRVNNGGCQDLCLLTSEGRVNCSCRGDRKLLEDNTCIGNTEQGFLIEFWLKMPMAGTPYEGVLMKLPYACNLMKIYFILFRKTRSGF